MTENMKNSVNFSKYFKKMKKFGDMHKLLDTRFV